MKQLICDIKNCDLCSNKLPHNPNPVVSFSTNSKILIIGQAPGTKVHNTGIPWNDKSGERLKEWLGVTDTEFRNTDNFGIVPMGFCFPGKGKTGDLPPIKECAPLWHPKILNELKKVKLTLLIGKYAQDYYLKNTSTLTETVKNFEVHLPNFIPLPHPSPRNNIWIKKNPWFEINLVPILKQLVKETLKTKSPI